MLLKVLHNIEREGKLPDSFYEASITLKTKLDKGITKNRKENKITDQFPL
jgi:hypothetical protein